MISSVFALKESDTIPEYLVPTSETKLEENYYINSTLNFLLECQEELLFYRQNFYKTILEASEENPYIINEAYSEILSKVRVIIKKILAYLETLLKRFVTQISKYVKSDRYIIRMKKQIEKFPADKSFNISGYEFTIDDNIPAIDIVGLDLSEINDKIKSIKGSDIVSKVAELTEMMMKLSDEGKMDDIRGQILNVNYPITETAFGNEIFSIFRDGKSEESTINIKKEDVNRALSDFEGYNSKIKNVKKLQNKINTKYKALESAIESIATADIMSDGSSKINNSLGSDKYSEDYINKLKRTLNNLITSQINQIQRISNLHIQTFAAKLDAYSALVVQDRNILYRALDTVQKDIDNTFIMKESYDNYDYTREAYYRNYVLEKYYINLNQRHFVEECLALSESNIPELKTINEDLKMDVKNKYEKIKKILQQIFEKFKNKITEFFNKDKKFLTENKNSIFKEIPEYTLNNMPQYSLGIKNIENENLPNTLDPEKIIPLTEVEIQKMILPEYDGKEDFSDFAKRFFLCNNTENKDRQSSDSEIDMKNIYEFCMEDKYLKLINNQTNKFNSEVTKIQSYILKSTNESSFNYLGTNYIYSTVLEEYINEEDATDKKDGIEMNSDKQSSSDQNAKSGAKLKLLDKPNEKDNTASDNKENNPEDNKNNQKDNPEDNKKDITKIEESANWYLKNLQTAITAKMTAYQKIYTEYMKIIRYHISVVDGKTTNVDNEEEIINGLKEYVKADKDSKGSIADKLISILKKSGKNYDRHDIDTLVKQNASILNEE